MDFNSDVKQETSNARGGKNVVHALIRSAMWCIVGISVARIAATRGSHKDSLNFYLVLAFSLSTTKLVCMLLARIRRPELNPRVHPL